MILYHLPGHGIFGGIKVGYRFAALLGELGVPAVATTPDGAAPQWFRTSVPTVSHAEAFRRLDARTTVVFSYPPDYPALLATGAPLVLHCQGTDEAIAPIVANPAVEVWTCWPQAREQIARWTGRATVDVGIAVGSAFFYDGTDKIAGSVAYMPRRGAAIARAARRRCRRLRFHAIDGETEDGAAAIMKRCEYFLATSVREWFGLPAFEAMAAGCVVVTVPVIGGMDFLRSGENCIVAAPEDVPEALAELARSGNAPLRARVRHGGRLTAFGLHEHRQRARLRALLDGELAHLRPPAVEARLAKGGAL